MTEASLLDVLESWYGRERPVLESRSLETNLHRSSEPPLGDKRLVRVDVDGASRLGSITLWDTGETEVSVIEYPSEKEVLTTSLTLSNALELNETVKNFVAAVAG